MFSFFLFIMPLLIVFSVESIYEGNVSADQMSNKENLKASSDTKLKDSTGDERKRNVVKTTHPLKFVNSSEIDIEKAKKKDEVKFTNNNLNTPSKEKSSELKETGDSDKKDVPKKDKNTHSSIDLKGSKFSKKEIELLAKFINAETGANSSYEAKKAVGMVVVNRLNGASHFGNTIEEVIFKKSQFSSIVNGAFEKATPTDKDLEVAVDVLEGNKGNKGSLFYYNPSIVASNWHETLTHTETVGDNKFFKENNSKVAVKSNETKPKAKPKAKPKKEIKKQREKPKQKELVEPKTEPQKETKKEESKKDKSDNDSKEESKNNKKQGSKTVSQAANKKIENEDSNEVEMLAKIIYAEARGEPQEGKLAVGAVVMNRVKSNSFSNTVEGVIHEKNQFTPVTNGAFASAKPTESERKAARDALNGKDNTNGALYFYSPSVAGKSNFHESLNHTVTIGTHKFFKSN